jgi:diguanylate cyclase (GGDEF)-like protein
MDFPTQIYHLSLLLQAAGAVLTGLVLHGFHRLEARRYLRQWTRSWIALSIHLSGAALGHALADRGLVGATWTLLNFVSATGGYLHVVFLLFGTYELAVGRDARTRAPRAVVFGLLGLGLAATLALTWDSGVGLEPFVTRFGVSAIIAGIAHVAAATGVFRAPRTTRGIGRHIVAVAFLVYGAQQLHYAGIDIATTVLGTGQSFAYAAYLGFLDFLIHSAMALGMVTWLLEEERGKTVRAAAEIEHLAYHDTLTGLPNRRLFLEHLRLAVASAARAGRMVGVFFLDLDRFKVINDSLGHATGDRVLRAVGDRIRSLVREGDTVARLGGDEFTILAPDVKGVEDLAAIARKVRDALKQPLVLDGRDLFVTASVGVSLFPADATEPARLVENADTAMYRAKAHGSDGFALYTPAMHERAVEQLALEHALFRALGRGEFVLHYQPILSTGTGAIVGIESVVRWNHPERGLLLPDEFMRAAEATGLIVPLGTWVLNAACAQLAAWHRAGHQGLYAAVNLSVRQLQQADFVSLVRTTLAHHALPPQSIELEVTETIAMQSGDGTVEKLRELKALGCRIAIDDFGTGYSSLSALRIFPVDALKIDVSFVRDIAADAADGDARGTIAAAVINLAHSLRLDVVAEGVEGEAQLAFLRGHGCDLWQGYYFSRPVTAEQCGELLMGPGVKAGAAALGIVRRGSVGTGT